MRIHDRGPNATERALLAKEPDLDLGARTCLRAWQELDSCRLAEQRPKSTKSGVVYLPVYGQIPYTAIVTWARVHELDAETLGLIAAVLRMLDVERAERIDSELRKG